MDPSASKTPFYKEPLNWLLAAVPLAIVLELAHAPALWIFLVSCVAIIPLAGWMGRSTEQLAHTMGPGVGGLLNATFGNAAELIIALMLLAKGPHMYPLVKASITGSIIGNILLVLGLAMVLGGARHKQQKFDRTAAGLGSTLLALATAGLIIPTIYFNIYSSASPTAAAEQQRTINYLSEEIALILALVYGLSLWFQLKTHRHLFAGEGAVPTDASAHTEPAPSRKVALATLFIATAGVALISEFLVGSIEVAAHAMNLNSVFVGVIVVAVIGNAAEHSTAVLVAMKNKMDLSVNVAVGSGIQIALFVAPVLVFASMLMGHGQVLDLHFTAMETVAVIISIAVLSMVSQDGECHWMEGVMLLAVYVILALAFYYLPESAETALGAAAAGH